jgi:hypothetical protein
VGFARDPDRWETYFDPFDKKIYFSANTAKNFNEAKIGSIFSADARAVTSAADLHPTFLRQDPISTPPFVMTSALDEAATLPSGATGRWVHFATLRCNAAALLDVETPFGLKIYDLRDPNDPTTLCDTFPLGGTLAPNLWHGPSVVGTASWPPRFYAAYTGRGATGTEIINVVEVTLRSAEQYNAPPIIRRLGTVDFSASGKHALFPQLIRVDSAGGSDLTVDTPIVLRYTLWDRSTNVEEHARAVYSGLAAAQTTDISLATWSVVTACGAGNGCFPGDYRYGTFDRKTNGTLTFFTPWSGQSSFGGFGVFGQGATIDIAPRN